MSSRNTLKMPATQIVAPIAISPRQDLRAITGQDLYSSINASLSSSSNRPSTPVHIIREHDYSVPAPPPPSPVSFGTEHWHAAMRR